MPAFGALSRGDRLLFILVLAVFGGVDAAYLTYEWYAHATASWCDIDPFWNCSKVRESSWSAIGGVPTATIGLAGFAILAALAVLALRGRERIGPLSTILWIIVFAILGASIGVVLTLVEIFVIRAICILCMLGFVLDLAILGLAVTLRGGDYSASRSE